MSRNLTYDVWLPYTRYEKHECDIKLKDGRAEISYCRFNIGKNFQLMAVVEDLGLYGVLEDLISNDNGIRYYYMGKLHEYNGLLKANMIEALHEKDWNFEIC